MILQKTPRSIFMHRGAGPGWRWIQLNTAEERPAMPSLRSPGGEGGRHAGRQEILPDGLAVPAETGKIREGREKPPPAFRRGIPNPSKSLEPTQPGLAIGGPRISYVLTAGGLFHSGAGAVTGISAIQGRAVQENGCLRKMSETAFTSKQGTDFRCRRSHCRTSHGMVPLSGFRRRKGPRREQACPATGVSPSGCV